MHKQLKLETSLLQKRPFDLFKSTSAQLNMFRYSETKKFTDSKSSGGLNKAATK